ncbi:hypothetical protein FKN01_11960 [Streptomyces sp. 130]|uniref:nuclear transport factor 2 family protein n=1 Tax=Streptomyces sp. 130 TaxID=2591006 RepID=UPI00117D62F1|nr:nuclear transport factor 2 family protein [Streptomyces sp. 130]TRV78891.1 hypothetical protein FKN01_11960 [Streptomyces sp. 130]
MSTTRHLVNRQRRLATVAAAERAATAAPPRPRTGRGPDPEKPDAAPDDAVTEDENEEEPEEDGPEEDGPGAQKTPARRRPRPSLPAVLCVLTLLLGAVAAWAFTSAASLRDDPSRQNTALTDISRTSEVKGQITEAVGAVFSYDYASPAKAETAVTKYLTGKAVQQHEDMLAEVRAQAPKQKLVLTTTVTDSGVEMLDGDRARLLIYADQRNTRTGTSEETTYAAAMFSVDAVRKGGSWRISAIDTFTR